jgi:hypothetical protein
VYRCREGGTHLVSRWEYHQVTHYKNRKILENGIKYYNIRNYYGILFRKLPFRVVMLLCCCYAILSIFRHKLKEKEKKKFLNN